MTYSLLATGCLGTTAAPDSPPARTPSGVLRSSPPFFAFLSWHRRQFLSKIGRISASKVGALIAAGATSEGAVYAGTARPLGSNAVPSTIAAAPVAQDGLLHRNQQLLPDAISPFPANFRL